MLDFLKKPKQKAQDILTEVISETITSEEIHNDFNNRIIEEEKILLDNKSSMENSEFNLDKIERLKKLGFTSNNSVVKEDNRKSQLEVIEKDLSIINHYKKKYPLYKFIKEDGVKSICEKYGLILGKISSFTGVVPNKNLEEMENFNKDNIKEDMCYYEMYRLGMIRTKPKQISYEQYKKYRIDDYSYSVDDQFQICAPPKDFKLDHNEEIDDFKIVTKKIEDPIVLFPVRDGYLIVTAWGEEASDPEVINEIYN